MSISREEMIKVAQSLLAADDEPDLDKRTKILKVDLANVILFLVQELDKKNLDLRSRA